MNRSAYRLGLLLLWLCWFTAGPMTRCTRGETPSAVRDRHTRVVQRRSGVHIICHRGSAEFAQENTLEAYRATFELGGDGNEIDIRATKDGVLVCFHDEMLDRLLQAVGKVSDYTYAELQRCAFRNPGRFGSHCRIPTLTEVLELHRRYAGLIHLDIKQPGLDRAVANLLTAKDMWDHVAYCNSYNSDAILKDSRLRLCRYKAPGLWEDHSDVFVEAVAAVLKKPGNGIIADDPRAAAVALGRRFHKLSSKPVVPRVANPTRAVVKLPSAQQLIAILRDADDWNRLATTPSGRAMAAERICARARAATQLLTVQVNSPQAFAALEERVRKRSLHQEWAYHGLDGTEALRTLILLRAPRAVKLARFVVWRNDPALKTIQDPRWNNPASWADFRMKAVVFPALQSYPSAETEKLCRDYLALDDEAARQIGPPLFEQAAKTLLTVSPRTETATALMKHRLQVVRGRAVLYCLAHAHEAWAVRALNKSFPCALALRVEFE